MIWSASYLNDHHTPIVFASAQLNLCRRHANEDLQVLIANVLSATSISNSLQRVASRSQAAVSPPTFTSFNWLPSSICSAHQLLEHSVDDLRNQWPCPPSSSGHDSSSNYSVSTCAPRVHFHSIGTKCVFSPSTPDISRPICTDCFVFFSFHLVLSSFVRRAVWEIQPNKRWNRRLFVCSELTYRRFQEGGRLLLSDD